MYNISLQSICARNAYANTHISKNISIITYTLYNYFIIRAEFRNLPGDTQKKSVLLVVQLRTVSLYKRRWDVSYSL